MNILPTITQEAISQCKKQGFVVSAALTSFYIRCQLINATKDPQGNVELSPEQIERLVSNSVRTLTMTDSPMLETFKMQASVITAQQEQVNALRTEKVQHRAKSQRLMEDVFSKRDPNDVFGDIVVYILHECRLLNTTNEVIHKETVSALESVFPRAVMDSFMSQRDQEKAKQLEEIWRIVWGIRVFNKESNKGGAGIPNLMQDARQILENCKAVVQKSLETVQQVSKNYAVVLQCPSLQLSDQQRLRLQDEYLNRLQYTIYLRSLNATLMTVESKLDEFGPTWSTSCEDVRILVIGQENTAVPKSTIYPRFIALTERWDVLYQLHREVLDTKSLFDLVVAYEESFATTLRQSDIDHAIAGVVSEHRPNRELIATEIKNPTVEYLRSVPDDKGEGRVEFNGFCIVSYVDEGVLLEGKQNEESTPGCIHLMANSAYYCFSSERSLKNFAKDPFKYLSQKLMDDVSTNPVLIYLLGLHPYLPKELYLAGTRQHEVAKEVSKGDDGTQTEQIDDYKDTKYVWNEWELRRLALQLASLRNKRTKSVQTASSHFRRDNETQIYLPKTQGTQTLLDAAVQPPREAVYLKGLRGTDSSRIETVRKTFLY